MSFSWLREEFTFQIKNERVKAADFQQIIPMDAVFVTYISIEILPSGKRVGKYFFSNEEQEKDAFARFLAKYDLELLHPQNKDFMISEIHQKFPNVEMTPLPMGNYFDKAVDEVIGDYEANPDNWEMKPESLKKAEWLHLKRTVGNTLNFANSYILPIPVSNAKKELVGVAYLIYDLTKLTERVRILFGHLGGSD